MRSADAARTSELAGLISAPADVLENSLEPETLRRIKLFRGLILRVKHAFIWDLAPLTAARLERTGLLLTAFADYSEDRALASFHGAPSERTRRFLQHLTRSPLAIAAKVDGVARHELLLLGREEEAPTGPRVWTTPSAACRIALASAASLEAFDAPPDGPEGAGSSALAAAAALALYRSGRTRIVRQPGETRMLRQALRGERLEAILAASDSRSPEAGLRFFEELCAEGFLAVEQVWTA